MMRVFLILTFLLASSLYGDTSCAPCGRPAMPSGPTPVVFPQPSPPSQALLPPPPGSQGPQGRNGGNGGSAAQDRPRLDQVQPGNGKSLPETAQGLYGQTCPGRDPTGYTVNFEDISIIQLIQFISKISGTNYVFDSTELGFNITLVSEDPATVDDLSALLLQILRMHDLLVVEQGNSVLIYRNKNMSKVSRIITDDNLADACDSPVITRVFRLYNVEPMRIAAIVRPLLSPDAIVEVSLETRHLIVSDMTSNVNRIADLLNALDTPSGAFEIREYKVKSGDPNILVHYAHEILGPLMSLDTGFRLIPQPAAGKIFIVSTPFMISKAVQVLESLDTVDITEVGLQLPSSIIQGNSFEVYKLKYHSGRIIAAALREIGNNLKYTGVGNIDFINTIYSIQWIEVNNSIVITGTQDAINKVLDLLKDLDIPPKQVYIEVLIIDTTLTNSLDFGVQWIALGDEQNKLAYASGLLSNSPPSPNLQGSPTTTPGARYPAANPAGNPPSIPNPGRDVALPVPAQLNGFGTLNNATSAFGLGFIGNIIRHNGESFLTLGALLSALDEEAITSVVLNPKIMVEDTQTANFFVGQNIPYQTTSTVIQQTGSVTQNIQYEDVGVQLRVTPTISPDNLVTLQIDQSVAEVVGSAGIDNLTPVTNKTLSTTRVHVPDGTFLVMSGHVRDSTVNIHSGIPCLGTLPCIGPLFSRTIDAREKRNLIFFIRPKVVSNIDEGIALTNEEGYNYNWESSCRAFEECGHERAPECETYPAYDWPPVDYCAPELPPLKAGGPNARPIKSADPNYPNMPPPSPPYRGFDAVVPHQAVQPMPSPMMGPAPVMYP